MNKKSFDDILVAFLITYALAAFSYEKYIPEGIMKFVQAVSFVAFAAVWLWNSFKSGKRRGMAFPVFTAVFWILPPVIIYLANDGFEIFRMSVIMYVLSELSDLIIVVPMKLTADAVGISAYGAIAVVLLLCAVCYLFGVFMEVDQ